MRKLTLLVLAIVAASCSSPSPLGSVPCSDFEAAELEVLLGVTGLGPFEEFPSADLALFACSSWAVSNEFSVSAFGYPVTAIDDVMGGFESLPSERLGLLLEAWDLPPETDFDEAVDRISVPEFQLAVTDHHGRMAVGPLVASETELAYFDTSGQLLYTRQYRDTVLMMGFQGIDEGHSVAQRQAAADYLGAVAAR